MGPMLFTGLACFGASVAVGILTASTSRASAETAGVVAARRLAFLLITFATGVGVIGVVGGLLAIELGAVSDPASGLLVALPAIAGCIVSLAIIGRRAGELDQRITPIGTLMSLAPAVLGVVVATLAVLLRETGTATVADALFVVLGLASAAASIAMGLTGSRVIPTLVNLDAEAATLRANSTLLRCYAFEFVGFGSAVIAIFLIVSA